MTDIVISAKNVSKVYGSGETAVTALDNVSFSAERGSFTAVTGTSGSGKSTLLHVLGGMDEPDSGEIITGGMQLFPHDKQLSRKAAREKLAIFRRQNIGFIFQSFNLVPVLTVRENLIAPLMLDGRNPDKDYMNEIVSAFSLDSRLDSYPSQLSGGQQQRVAIARSLISRPALILADEPTGNLDTKNSREIISLFKQCVQKYGQTLVIVTHNPEIAAEADRTVFMSDGRLAEVI